MRKEVKILFIILIAFCIFPLKTEAGLQAKDSSNGLSAKQYDWPLAIRRMESTSGTLGKEANINETTLVDSSKNGIDCHMMRNSEYGALSILAWSEYGGVKSTATNNSTGNKTGVIYGANQCYVSEFLKEANKSYLDNMKLIDQRYFDNNITTNSFSGYGYIYELTVFGYIGSYPSSNYPGLKVYSFSNITNYDSTYTSSSMATVVCGTDL